MGVLGLRGNKSGYSPERAEMFFKRLRAIGNQKLAASSLGIHPCTIRGWRMQHPEFAAKLAEVKKELKAA